MVGCLCPQTLFTMPDPGAPETKRGEYAGNAPDPASVGGLQGQSCCSGETKHRQIHSPIRSQIVGGKDRRTGQQKDEPADYPEAPLQPSETTGRSERESE